MISRPIHFKRLLKFLRRKGRSREDAEDLIQEAMLRLHLYGQEVTVVNEAPAATQLPPLVCGSNSSTLMPSISAGRC